MSASAAPPNRSRYHGRRAHSAQGLNRGATPQCPCGDPRLREPELHLVDDSALPVALPAARLNRRSVGCRGLVRQRLLLKLRHRTSGKSGNGSSPPAPTFRSSWPRSEMGQEVRFSRPRLNGRCRLRYQTCLATPRVKRGSGLTFASSRRKSMNARKGERICRRLG